MARRKDIFNFKEFAVQHDRCTMKVGTDAVLLGAWVKTSAPISILDIGTGSGIIALMLAQRTKGTALIDAIEPSYDDAQQATENVRDSPWSKNITIFNKALQEFITEIQYDLIVTNPPYFNNSQLPPSDKRSAARHTKSLSHSDLLKYSTALLAPSGHLGVILPYEEGNQFKDLAKEYKLYCNRQLAFFSRPGKPQERWIFEFSFREGEILCETLYLHAKEELWSDEYKALTRDFYLKL